MQLNFRRAARRAAEDADLVHAHWLPSGAVALSTRKPFVLQVWGTDLEIARRVPALAKPILRRAELVIAPSTALADQVERLGARDVRVIPSGVDIPAWVPEPDEPPHVLYAGRLSREKGILDLVEAARGLPLVVAGDGPLRDQVPQALGMVPHEELLPMYTRAAVVACPSHREGFGVVCAEAMAHGRPVVASAVGGLLDLVVDGVTGLLVEPGDVAGLRAALERLLGDRELRRRLGDAARARARERLSWGPVTGQTLAAYRSILSPGDRSRPNRCSVPPAAARGGLWPGRRRDSASMLRRSATDLESVSAPATPPVRAGAVELSVVIPCLDEAATLGVCVAKALEFFERLGIEGEVVVADNGSTDGSRELAVASGARLVDVPERGYGAALAAGIAAARGEFVIMGDADDSYDFSKLDAFVAGLRAGNDLVVGNRFSGGIRPGAMPALHRYFGNPALTFISRRFFGSPAGDVYCGLRGFRRSAIQELDLRSTGMEFAIEMVVKSSLHRLRIVEVPTTLSPDGRDRAPHLRTWRDGWRSLRFLLLYSPSWLFLYPGILMIAVGSVVMALLALRTRTIGGVTFDVHTLLYAAFAVIIGYQAVIFSAGAKLFAVTEGLLPPTPRSSRLLGVATLEVAIAVGLVLFALGLGGSIFSVVRWENRAFGRLDYADTLRVVIPSAALLALGSQTILAGFFLSLLGLKRR